METEHLEQGTQEWRDARAGNVTASGVKYVLTNPRKGQTKSSMRDSYMAQLISERKMGRAKEEDKGGFFDVERGKRLEPIARVEYEMRQKVDVVTAGFKKHPLIPWFGCSPDALVGNVGMAQFKAPRLHVFIDWRIDGVVPAEHRDQMFAELSCYPERQWSDFVAYVDDDDLPQDEQMFCVRLYRDEAQISKIESAVAKFNAELEEKMKRLAVSSMSLQEQLEKSLEMVTKQ